MSDPKKFKLRLKTNYGFVRAGVDGKNVYVEKVIYNGNSTETTNILMIELAIKGKSSLKSANKEDVIEYMKRMK